MVPSRLSSAAKKTVGMKETKKLIENDGAEVVYIAKDAEEHVVRPVIELCKDRSIPVIYVESMSELGKACEISVGAATAAIEEDDVSVG